MRRPGTCRFATAIMPPTLRRFIVFLQPLSSAEDNGPQNATSAAHSRTCLFIIVMYLLSYFTMTASQSQIKIPNRKNPIGKKIVYIIVSIFQPFRQSPFILLSNRGMIGVRKGRRFLRETVGISGEMFQRSEPL